jgi:hypothetical protein
MRRQLTVALATSSGTRAAEPAGIPGFTDGSRQLRTTLALTAVNRELQRFAVAFFHSLSINFAAPMN